MWDKEFVSFGKLPRSEYILWAMAIWYLWPRHTTVPNMRFAVFVALLLVIMLSGIASNQKLKHLEKTELQTYIKRKYV